MDMKKKQKAIKPARYVIQELITPNTDEVLYWNNKIGFTDLPNAEVFNQTERDTLNLPLNSTWIELPQIPDLEVVVRVSGGVVQSAIANDHIAVDVFDIDNKETATDDEINAEWTKLKESHPIGVL